MFILIIIIGYLHIFVGNILTRQIYILQLIAFLSRIVWGRNLSIQERIMSVIRANRLYMEDDTHCNEVCVLYKPRSDFINLSKLNVLGLARNLEAGRREESQRTLTLKRWIWENMVRVIDTIGSGMRMKWEIESTSDGDMSLRNKRKTHYGYSNWKCECN